MADPLLDEDYILGLLSVPVVPENGQALQSAAMQTLCDLYDRKVTREEFQQSGAACVSLYTYSSKMMFLANMHEHFKDEKLNAAAFKEAADGFENVVRTQAQHVIEIVKRLKLCPISGDKVH